jgi:precorrin-3B synthase
VPVTSRTHPDRCPGVFRPWLAEDGAIVRLRVPGGRLPAAALRSLVTAAEVWGDGTVLLTKRANLQLRGIATSGRSVPPGLVDALRAAGLLPSDTHELVRNILSSPLSGRIAGRIDLRPVVEGLDRALCADPHLADLGGRFLFVLDDGRGDVLDRPLDLGLVAVSEAEVQIRVGSSRWGPVVPVQEAVPALVELARSFRQVRGAAPTASWHVDELPPGSRLLTEGPRDPRTTVVAGPVAPGWHSQDNHRALFVASVPNGMITGDVAEGLLAHASGEVVITPWRSVVIPDLEAS